MSKELDWLWDEAVWWAYSAAHDGGIPFRWVVNPLKNGKFGISHSTSELADDREFLSLQAAQDYCQQFENDVESMVDDILFMEAGAATKPASELDSAEVSTCRIGSDEASGVVRMELEIRFPAKGSGVRFRVTSETTYVEPDDQPKNTIRKLED
jgi:hypothetical protein